MDVQHGWLFQSHYFKVHQQCQDRCPLQFISPLVLHAQTTYVFLWMLKQGPACSVFTAPSFVTFPKCIIAFPFLLFFLTNISPATTLSWCSFWQCLIVILYLWLQLTIFSLSINMSSGLFVHHLVHNISETQNKCPSTFQNFQKM